MPGECKETPGSAVTYRERIPLGPLLISPFYHRHTHLSVLKQLNLRRFLLFFGGGSWDGLYRSRSFMAPHCPHEGQWPEYSGVTIPQDWQMNRKNMSISRA